MAEPRSLLPHLIVFPVDERQLELEFGWVDGKDTRPTLPVQAVNVVPLHPGHIDWQVQGTDDPMVPRQRIWNIREKDGSRLLQGMKEPYYVDPSNPNIFVA